uniref:BRO-N domain-containing protein n=1 Tax=Candidatus Regiella insecticola TaxID=138073 RepID=UPI0005867F4E
MTIQLTFRTHQFDLITRDNNVWFTCAQLTEALEYADDKAVQRIYSRHADEFTLSMTAVVKLTTPSGDQSCRVFSLRGAHLIAMLARTLIAKEFRKWLLDIMDKEVGCPQYQP